jgi:hypothetical protein
MLCHAEAVAHLDPAHSTSKEFIRDFKTDFLPTTDTAFPMAAKNRMHGDHGFGYLAFTAARFASTADLSSVS